MSQAEPTFSASLADFLLVVRALVVDEIRRAGAGDHVPPEQLLGTASCPALSSAISGPSAVIDPDPDELLLPEEVSRFLKRSVSTLAKWRMTEGRGPTFVRMSGGGRVLYRRRDVQDFIRNQLRGCTLETPGVKN